MNVVEGGVGRYTGLRDGKARSNLMTLHENTGHAGQRCSNSSTWIGWWANDGTQRDVIT
ncbi:hypothetical protein MA16_Dca015343 [Dendrobium catenatum]|uniref:Uncharacterized protein n=1 Tax=Dendrobium catenatum TaxID=906689 RepID=A0A2I0W1C5_9ASPA|nr:hypothetical protein MA16_Dca015343 [Dendrobium catenatum]